MIEKNAKWVFLAPTLLVIVVVGIYPLIYALWSSLSSVDPGTMSISGFTGLANYVKVLTNWRFWNALKVTGLFVLICVPIELTLGFVVALAFDTDNRLLENTRAIFIIQKPQGHGRKRVEAHKLPHRARRHRQAIFIPDLHVYPHHWPINLPRISGH